MGTLIFVLFIISIVLLGNTIFTAIFSLEHYKTHKKRLEQLKFDNKRTSDKEEIQNLINKVTKPAITYILPFLKVRNEKELERDLKLAGWNEYFNARTYIALNVTLKIVGGALLVILFPLSKIIALIWFFVFFMLLGILFKNSLKEKKSKLLIEFPDFIRITQGYLSADLPFTQAIEKTIIYSNAWQPLLKNFIINCEVKSIEYAIDVLVEEVNIFQVRELFSLVKLNLEQGIDIKESFENQADRVRELQLLIFESKIRKRQVMCMLLQAPILLCIFGAFGLPTIYSMINLSSMS